MTLIPMGSFVRIADSPFVPPLLRGHYAEVRGTGQRDAEGSWRYKVRAYTWVWGPTLEMDREALVPVSAETAARHTFLIRQDQTFTPGGAADQALDEAIEALRDAFVGFHRALGLTQEQLRKLDFDLIWQAFGVEEAAASCRIAERKKTQTTRVRAAWDDLVLASHRVAEDTERIVTGM